MIWILLVLLVEVALNAGIYRMLRSSYRDPRPLLSSALTSDPHFPFDRSRMFAAVEDHSPAAAWIRALMAAAEQPWRLDYLTHMAIRRCHDQARGLDRVLRAVLATFVGLMGSLVGVLWSAPEDLMGISVAAILLLLAHGAAFAMTGVALLNTTRTPAGILALRNVLYTETAYLPPQLAHLAP